jgi:peptidyl-prolyl cis-trans isomerase B (cyclophilin B)
MARQGNNATSQGSQFFIVYKDSYFSNDTAGGYSVFGKITTGLGALAAEVKKGVVKGASDGKPVGRFQINNVDINKPKASAPSASATSGAK